MGKTEKSSKGSGWMGAFKAYDAAFKQLQANPAPAVLFIVAYSALKLVEMGTIGLGPEHTDLSYFLKYMAFESVFGLVFLLALPVYGLALADRKPISVSDFLRPDARKYFALFVAGALYALAVLGSLLLLIIPAIWVIAWFVLYEMVIVDKNMGPVQALKESKKLLFKHKGKVWGLVGVSVLLTFPASLLQLLPVVGAVLSSAAAQFVAVLGVVTTGLLYRWAQSNSK